MFFFSSFWTTALVASALGAVGVEAIVRGVNLGGWLVAEPWCVSCRGVACRKSVQGQLVANDLKDDTYDIQRDCHSG